MTTRIPLPVPYAGTMNAWLLAGDPLTLVDCGDRSEEALAALEQGLAGEGVRVADLELIVATHHHVDHTGLIATVARMSGAQVAALESVAAYGAEYVEAMHRERRFAERLLTRHGVPAEGIGRAAAFWDFIESSDGYVVDRPLRDGDVLRAGGRDLRVVDRPGHSATDTLFVDERDGLALVGDHLLARVSSIAEIGPPPPGHEAPGRRRRALVDFVAGMRRTAELPLRTLLPGHGRAIDDHAAVIAQRLRFHGERCDTIAAALVDDALSAYEIALRLWDRPTVLAQPVLTTWEVLGHLDPLVDAGRVERVDVELDRPRFRLASRGRRRPAATRQETVR